MDVIRRSEVFWHGYSAFVMGGRKTLYVGPREILASGGWEPLDGLSDAEKTEWRQGVEFANSERAECLEINRRTEAKKRLQRVKAENYGKICELLRLKKFNDREIGDMTGVSAQVVLGVRRKLGIRALTNARRPSRNEIRK